MVRRPWSTPSFTGATFAAATRQVDRRICSIAVGCSTRRWGMAAKTKARVYKKCDCTWILPAAVVKDLHYNSASSDRLTATSDKLGGAGAIFKSGKIQNELTCARHEREHEARAPYQACPRCHGEKFETESVKRTHEKAVAAQETERAITEAREAAARQAAVDGA